MKITILAGAAIAAALITSATAAPFTGLAVFGDSLSDPGNGFIASGGTSPPPALGYFQGRVTNGYNAVDYLSLGLFGTPTTPGLSDGDNWAFGGARASTNADVIPDLAAQVSLYAAANPGGADASKLHVIFAGGNDAFAILFGQPDAPTFAAVGTSVRAAIDGLIGLGARSFLIVDVPDVGDAPLVNGLEGPARAVSLALNAAIDAALADLVVPGGEVFRFDTIGVGDIIDTNAVAGGYGITEVPCLAVPGASPACAGFAFFDQVHITTVVHRLYGRAMLAQVPAPAALALFGLGLLALARRRAA